MKIAVGVVAVLAVVGLTGCSSSTNPGAGSGGPTNTGPHSSAAAPVPPSSSTPAPSTATGASSPTAQQRGALLAGLRAVNPALVADQDEAVTRSRNVCQKLQSGEDANSVTTYIRSEFADSAYTPNQTDALVILSLARGILCPA